MEIQSNWRLGVLLPVAAAGLAFSSTVSAQDDEAIFEEIVVTVQRREQNIMDVPVAVSTLSGTQITDAGIKDMFDLQQNVPGLIVGQSQSATTSNFAIRGIGSTSNNFGVESSVGLYVDGIYRSRQSTMINDLVDVEAVDVLRGPQGTLFGKNTAAGAISVHTVRPSRDADAFVDVTVGDLNLLKVSGAANIPVGENSAIRGTIFATQRDGFVDDLGLGSNVHNDRDRMGARLQFALNEPSDDFNLRIIADYSEIDEICCVAISRVDSLYHQFKIPGVAAGQINPLTAVGSDAVNAQLGGTVFATYNYPQPMLDGFAGAAIVPNSRFDDYVTAVSELPVSTNEDAGLSLDFSITFGNGITLKSISAFRAFETFDSIDIDFSDVDLLNQTKTAEQSSFSQEFQFTGEFGSGSSWVAGAYYFGQDLDSTTTTTARALFPTYIDILNPDLALTVLAIEQLRAGLVGTPLEGVVAPATPAFIPGADGFDVVKQDHEGYAVFGQIDFAFNDMFTLTVGARFTDETKDIDATYVQTANGPPPDQDAILAALFGASQGDFSGILSGALVPVTEPNIAWGSYLFPPLAPRSDVVDSLSDDQTTGTVKLSFFPADSTMVYASYATGFKAGGTNAQRIDPTFDQIFGPETSESFEVGLKGQYGPVQLVLTYFETDFEDFQAQSFEGNGFFLQNAGDLETSGIEVEVLWRPTDSTEIQAFYTLNEGEYTSFDNGTGWDTHVFHSGEFDCPPVPLPPPPFNASDRPTSCSRTGDPIPYNPEDRFFLALTQDIDLSSNTSAFARFEYTYASDQFTDGDLDPFTHQDSVEMINVRFGLNVDSWNSSFTLWGRNITDERWYHGSFDVPVAGDKMLSYPSEPATFGLTFRKHFD
ncbi:MAG: TonB-dependent receptor [Woeseiaceae bacterium]|nr:TonB-dependent receptor [Woeseiaceae bacterium]